MISIIAAIGRNRELGKGNELLWRMPADLKRFRSLTRGHPCIMGRKTFESIVAAIGSPLPERTNIVITRDPRHIEHAYGKNEKKGEQKHGGLPSMLVAESLDEALGMAAFAEGSDETFIIGGAQIYTLGLAAADKLYLTLIDDTADADAFFPAYEDQFIAVSEERGVHDGIGYVWCDLIRKA